MDIGELHYLQSWICMDLFRSLPRNPVLQVELVLIQGSGEDPLNVLGPVQKFLKPYRLAG